MRRANAYAGEALLNGIGDRMMTGLVWWRRDEEHVMISEECIR